MSTNTADLTNYHPKPPKRSPEDYLDLLDKSRPHAKNPMSPSARAAQFSPYAALVGHKEIIQTDEELMSDKTDLDQEIFLELEDNNYPADDSVPSRSKKRSFHGFTGQSPSDLL